MRGTNRDDRGSVLVIVLIMMLVVFGMAAAIMSVSTTHNKDTVQGQQWEHAMAIAEAGVDDGVNRMNKWISGSISTCSGRLSTGSYAVTVTPAFAGVGGEYTLKSTAWLSTAPNVAYIGKGTGQAALFSAVGGDDTVVHGEITTGANGVAETRLVAPDLYAGTRSITVVVYATYSGMWVYGLFSDQALDLSSNIVSDSYDSVLGTYASQATNTYGPTPYARTNGTDGSNHGVVEAANDRVFGSLVPGPGYTVTPGVGSYVSGTTTPAAAAVVFPPITVPVVAGAPLVMAVGVHGTGNITGTVHYSSITTASNSTLSITGPATILVDSLILNSNTEVNINTAAGPVKFYGTGQFLMRSNNALQASTGLPADLQIYITTDNYTGFEGTAAGNPAKPVGFSSNGIVSAAIYAPNATQTWASNTMLFGSSIAKKIPPASNFQVHYDEALARVGGGPPKYKTKAWYENPADR